SQLCVRLHQPGLARFFGPLVRAAQDRSREEVRLSRRIGQNPTSPEAHTAMAGFLVRDAALPGAQSHLERALELRPGYPAARAALLLMAALACGCRGGHRNPTAPRAAPTRSSARFVNVAEKLGIRWRHVNGRSGRFYFPETMGSGCAFLDYDGDGRLDLFLVNSSRLPGFKSQGPFYPALYHQRPDGTFEEVTQRAGLAIDLYGMGCAVGDYDNDGHPDLYLT